MISFLRGIIEEKTENSVIIDVNGVGYEVSVSTTTMSSLPIGEMAKVLTYMAVREDGVYLFGFSSHEERDLFNKLITVSGIGPKVAIGILSGMNLGDLTVAIVKQDLKMLSTIKGLGKKTAERLCVELKDKLDMLGMSEQETLAVDYNEDAVQMATDTLISLGINKNEAYSLARANAGNNATAEEIISKALRGYRG